MRSFFRIYECISDDDAAGGTFIIIETYDTSDGRRSRICDGTHHSRDAAERAWKKKVDANSLP